MRKGIQHGLRKAGDFISALVFSGLTVTFGLPVGTAPAGEVEPALKVGDVLDSSNWELARDLLPPEILRHYKEGQYRNRIVDYPPGTMQWERSFNEATRQNANKLAVDERGTIVDKETGKQPPFYFGVPFPDIDPNDPDAAVKIIWNQFLAYWVLGDMHNRTLVVMLGPAGIDRQFIGDAWFKFWDGQIPKYRLENTLNLMSQFVGNAVEPADLQGTATLTWRYRDPTKRDSVWAYVPALRRVRAVSPANRSDGYLGSDFSGDDGFFFDGKPEDFTWKLVGKQDALRIVDPESIGGQLPVQPIPGGGFVGLTDRNPPTVGYRTPGWTGVSWAPTDAGLARRPMWIIEATPRDRYYLYGRMQMWIDAEDWRGAWNRKFSWGGEPVQVFQMLVSKNHPTGGDDPEWITVGTQVWACAENVKLNRATLGGMRPYPAAAFQRRVPTNRAIFDPAALGRLGK
jgi:hypothetical protein